MEKAYAWKKLTQQMSMLLGLGVDKVGIRCVSDCPTFQLENFELPGQNQTDMVVNLWL